MAYYIVAGTGKILQVFTGATKVTFAVGGFIGIPLDDRRIVRIRGIYRPKGNNRELRIWKAVGDKAAGTAGGLQNPGDFGCGRFVGRFKNRGFSIKN